METNRYGYIPVHPASSPWVVAVGATMGPDYGLENEIACQSQLPVNAPISGGGKITSGGGFSMHNPRPSWQSAAVEKYLSSKAGKNAAPGYNPNGRAYPDISFLGVRYPTIIGGLVYSVYGTSASTPLAAALSK